MSVFFFLELHDSSGKAGSLSTEARDGIAAAGLRLPGLARLNVFTPAEGGEDPYLRDAFPPPLVMQVVLPDPDALQSALASAAMQDLVAALRGKTGAKYELVQEALLADPWLSADTSAGKADISYLVNYQRPAEDEKTFLEYYRDHHPAILLRFPGLRRLELGLPLDWSASMDARRADRMLYCEVSFDSIGELNTALQSSVRAELRRDYERFPPFSGPVTHFPMHRRAVH